MIWTYTDFQTEYNAAELSETLLTAVLNDAEAVIASYITAEAYADASAASPTDTVAFRLIRRAIGDIALLYLRQRNQIAPVTASYTKSYSGVKSYSVSGGNSAAAVADTLTEAKILSRLTSYQATLPSLACETWGTGRIVGVITASDLAEEEEGF